MVIWKMEKYHILTEDQRTLDVHCRSMVQRDIFYYIKQNTTTNNNLSV